MSLVQNKLYKKVNVFSCLEGKGTYFLQRRVEEGEKVKEKGTRFSLRR